MAEEFKSQISKKSLDKFEKKGFNLPNKPKVSQKELPDDLDQQSVNKIILLMAEYSGWTDYAEGQLALAENELDCLDSAYNLSFDKKLMEVDPKEYSNVTDRKAVVNTDKEMEDLEKILLEKKSYKRLLERMFRILERRQSVCSRVLSAKINKVKEHE
jgi:hypothetical protein